MDNSRSYNVENVIEEHVISPSDWSAAAVDADLTLCDYEVMDLSPIVPLDVLLPETNYDDVVATPGPNQVPSSPGSYQNNQIEVPNTFVQDSSGYVRAAAATLQKKEETITSSNLTSEECHRKSVPQDIAMLCDLAFGDKDRLEFIDYVILDSVFAKAHCPPNSQEAEDLKRRLNSMKDFILQRYVRRRLDPEGRIPHNPCKKDAESVVPVSSDHIVQPLKPSKKEKQPYPVQLKKGVWQRAYDALVNNGAKHEEVKAEKVARELFNSVMDDDDILNCSASGKMYKKGTSGKARTFDPAKVTFIREGLQFILARPSKHSHKDFLKAWRASSLPQLKPELWSLVMTRVLQTYAYQQRAILRSNQTAAPHSGG